MKQAIPAQIFIGTQEDTNKQVIAHIQKKFCKQNRCEICVTCRSIATKQHHEMLWIEPEKRYVLDDFSALFSQISFSLKDEDQFVFVIEQIDYLTTACANALLKIVEEPPRGYFFIFTTTRLAQVIPTIRSRCITQIVNSSEESLSQNKLMPQIFHKLLEKNPDPILFTKLLTQSDLSEQESFEQIDYLLAHAITTYKNAILKKDFNAQKQAAKQVSLFQEAMLNPPASGGTKLFWKNIFLKKYTDSLLI